MDRSLLGIFMAAGTGLLWALTTPATKLLALAGVDISTAVLARMVVVSLILGPWLRLRRPRELRISRRDLWRIFLFSFLGPSCLYLGFMLSVVYLNAATALVLHYTFPIVIALCSSAVTGERPARADLAGACLVTVGVGFSVLRPDWTLDTAVDVRGILWGVLAVAGLAGQTLLGRASVTRGGVSSFVMFFYSHVFGVFWISLYKCLFTGWGDLGRVGLYAGALILVPTLLGCLLGYALYYKALEYVPASTAGLMASVEILGAVVMTSAVTRAWPGAPQVAGCVLIFCAIALVSLAPRGGS